MLLKVFYSITALFFARFDHVQIIQDWYNCNTFEKVSLIMIWTSGNKMTKSKQDLQLDSSNISIQTEVKSNKCKFKRLLALWNQNDLSTVKLVLLPETTFFFLSSSMSFGDFYSNN